MNRGGAAAADLVLTGGIIYTMSPIAPRAEAVAIRGGRIEAVGRAAEIAAYVGPKTRVIELGGRAVLPGLVDGHAHLYQLGVAMGELDLKKLTSAQAVADEVRRAAADRPRGEWILGRGWDQNLWTPPEFSTHDVLDAAAPDHPVALGRIDGHAIWVNGAALRLAGIDAGTPDPAGGRIVRDAKGKPTGVLIDRAMELVLGRIPAPAPEGRERTILAAADWAVAHGLTGVHEMGGHPETVAAYRRLAAQGKLKLRVVAYLRGEGTTGGLEWLAGLAPDDDPDGTARFVARGVKIFADGALGSRGAALLAPYADDPGNSGLLLATPEELARAVEIAVAGGWQLATHAIGDRANRIVLDAYERAGPERRFRIEHAQVVAPEDLPRFARLGVIAAMQPVHATSDMGWADERLGPERLAGAYAWRSLLASGAHVVGGSDFPFDEPSPMVGLYAATTRQDREGQPPGGWLPEQRLGFEEAVRLYTVEAAWASFVENHRGKLVAGFVADLTVLDRDPADPRSLLETQVDLTIVGGDIVFERPR